MSTFTIVAMTHGIPYRPILEQSMCQQMKYTKCHPQVK